MRMLVSVRDVPEALLRDALRVQTARFLMRHVRGSEAVVRLDDDAFLVVLPGADDRDTDRVARRLQLLAFNKAPGALALGHPWGASGAVLVVRLFSQLVRAGRGSLGLAAVAAGGGQGVAVVVERVA